MSSKHFKVTNPTQLVKANNQVPSIPNALRGIAQSFSELADALEQRQPQTIDAIVSAADFANYKFKSERSFATFLHALPASFGRPVRAYHRDVVAALESQKRPVEPRAEDDDEAAYLRLVNGGSDGQ